MCNFILVVLKYVHQFGLNIQPKKTCEPIGELLLRCFVSGISISLPQQNYRKAMMKLCNFIITAHTNSNLVGRTPSAEDR